METITLKDKQYNIIGYIDTDKDGKQTLKDRYYSILGYYDPKTNETKDKYCEIVGQGNLLTTLLKQ